LINKHKLKVLLNKYKEEIKGGNLFHLKDYIGACVILDLINANVYFDDMYKYIELSHLLLSGDWKVPIDYLKVYEVPSLDEMRKFKHRYSKISNFNTIDFIYRNAAYTWFILMIENGMMCECDVIDLTMYKLSDFIHDYRLLDILNEYSSKKSVIKIKAKKKEEKYMVFK